jgi:deoxycytidine triphosphate deaminase
MIISAKLIESLVRDGQIVIDPFDVENLKAASYTFTLGPRIRVLKKGEILDLREKTEPYIEKVIGPEGHVLEPGAFLMCESLETLKLGPDIGCKLHMRGQSSRKGVDFVGNEGFCEPGSTGGGTDGRLAFVTTNHGSNPVKLFVGIPAVKATFFFIQDTK